MSSPAFETHEIGSDPEFSYLLERWDSSFQASIDCGYGWAKLIDNCHRALENHDPNYEIFQIKQKFGGLRFYFGTKVSDREVHRQMQEDVYKFERESFHVCEICGNHGELRKQSPFSYVSTLCETHATRTGG